MSKMAPLSEMSKEQYSRVLKKAERLKMPDSSFGMNYQWRGDEPFDAERGFKDIVYPVINIALPDLHILTTFSHPDGFGVFAIAPFAGVFIICNVEKDGFSVFSEAFNKKEQEVLVKKTSPTGDDTPIQEYTELVTISRKYKKPAVKPEVEIWGVVSGPSEADDRCAYLAYKHIDDYHVLPLD